jgi:hypothetical protein
MKVKYFFLILLLIYPYVFKAQVQVRDEPRHHLVFENEYLRILDVHLEPGDTTLYHLHNTPSVFIWFTKTATASQLFGKEVTRDISIPKNISYDSLQTERHHRVWNEDKKWFHVNDVELISKGPFNSTPPLQHASLKLLNNEKQVNIYRLQLSDETVFVLSASAAGYLLMSLDETTLIIQNGNIQQTRKMKPGHYEWIEPGTKPILTLFNGKQAEFALLQLK